MQRTWRRWMAVAAGICALFEASSALAESATVRRVRSDLEAFVRERVEGEIASLELPPLRAFDFEVAEGLGEIRTELSTESELPLRGRVSIAVELWVGQQLVKHAVVSPYIKQDDLVIVAARSLGRGQVLGEADLRESKRDRAKTPGDSLRDRATGLGMRVKRSVAADQVLRQGDLEAVPVVERGDRVTLVLRRGPLLVQAAGKAQESGTAGEWIRVVNLDSKRELSGRVDGEGLVHVAF